VGRIGRRGRRHAPTYAPTHAGVSTLDVGLLLCNNIGLVSAVVVRFMARPTTVIDL